MARISINFLKGTIEVDAEEQHLEAASQQAILLMERMSETQSKFIVAKPQNDQPPSGDAVEAQSPPKVVTQSKPKRKPGGTKSKNWTFIPNLVDDSGWAKVQQFYNEKKPKTQNERVAVLCVVLSELLAREGFDGNEIHSAFKTVGQKTPANLQAVFGNMATHGLGHTTDGKFHLAFKGNQLVEHSLPKEEPTK